MGREELASANTIHAILQIVFALITYFRVITTCSLFGVQV